PPATWRRHQRLSRRREISVRQTTTRTCATGSRRPENEWTVLSAIIRSGTLVLRDAMVKGAPKFAKASSLIGLIVWAIVFFFRSSPSPELNLINEILLLAILVIVPLGLSLVATPYRNGRDGLPYRLAVFVQ